MLWKRNGGGAWFLFVELKSIRLESVREFEDVTIRSQPAPKCADAERVRQDHDVDPLADDVTGAVPDASTAKGFKRAYGGTKERSTVTLELFIGPEAEKAEHHRSSRRWTMAQPSQLQHHQRLQPRAQRNMGAAAQLQRNSITGQSSPISSFSTLNGQELARTQDITQVDPFSPTGSVNLAMCEAGGPTPPVLDALLKKREEQNHEHRQFRQPMDQLVEAVEAHCHAERRARPGEKEPHPEGQVRDKEAEWPRPATTMR